MEKLILQTTDSAWKPDSECTSEDFEKRKEIRDRCESSFLYFFSNFCRIVLPAKFGEDSGGIVNMLLTPHLKTFIGTILTARFISLLKARQIWISTTMAHYVLWRLMFRRGSMTALFSKGQPEAKELLAKSLRAYNLLPDFLRLKLDPDSTEELGCPDMTSSIKAFPSTASAGISYTTDLVIADEHAEHPYAEENYLAAKPSLSHGGQFISIFTPNPWQPDNFATALFRDAIEKKNDFVSLFFNCYSIPGRDEEWYESEKRNISERDLKGLTKDLYMSKAYPRTIEEALSIPSTVAVFSSQVIDEMMADVRNPIKVVVDGVDSNIVHVYKDFKIGEYYIAATDTSHGVGRDYGVTAIMNVRTGDVVSDIMENDISPEELAYQSVKLLEHYRSPLWYIESNDYGGVTIATAQREGYKNFGYQDDKREKIGFNTNSFRISGQRQGSRVDLWGSLIPAINTRHIVIYNKDGLNQFRDIIRNIKKEGRIEAASNRHDDYPITIGICWLKKDEVQFEKFDMKPIQTLHFNQGYDKIRWK